VLPAAMATQAPPHQEQQMWCGMPQLVLALLLLMPAQSLLFLQNLPQLLVLFAQGLQVRRAMPQLLVLPSQGLQMWQMW